MTKLIPLQLHHVSETVDEMGSVGKSIGYFTDVRTAHLMAEGRGWYGGKGNVTKVHVIAAGDGTYFVLADKDAVGIDIDPSGDLQTKKDAILAKLTASERELLGL